MRRKGELDLKDQQILGLLEEDSRKSISEIGRLTGLSAPTVAERIARMRDINIIERFTVQLNYLKAGLPLGAIIELHPKDSNDQSAIKYASALPEVQSSYLVTGTALLILIVRVADNDRLKALLADLARFGETKTSVILSTLEEKRAIFPSTVSPEPL